jgi:ABC-type spermidine/putrescine transport system permease subunit I
MFNKKYTMFLVFALLPVIMLISINISIMLAQFFNVENVTQNWNFKKHISDLIQWWFIVLTFWLVAVSFTSEKNKSGNLHDKKN